MRESVFTKIIKGEIPCHKIYEDELTFAFLDIHPIQPGHTLVIPKIQIEFAWDLPDEAYQALMATSKKLAIHMKTILGVPLVGMQIEGLDVPHAHIKLIPFSTHEEFFNHPDMMAEPNHAALAQMAERLVISTPTPSKESSNVH